MCGYENELTGYDDWCILNWEEKNFSLCYKCLKKLYLSFENEEEENIDIKIIRKTIHEELRNKIFKRDKYKCKKCGAKEDLTIDHIIPFSGGGTTEINNLATLCRKCNSKKGANK